MDRTPKEWDCINRDGYVVGVALGESADEAALYAIKELRIEDLSHVEEREHKELGES